MYSMSGIYHPISGGQNDEQMDRCTDKWTTGRTDKWTERCHMDDGWIDELMGGQMDEQKDGRMDKQTDVQTEG
jgi:hypothetical protein